MSPLRLATTSDLPSVQALIASAYEKYLDRMERPPAPIGRDYNAAVEAGTVWVAGEPVVGLISLIHTDDSLLIENVAVDPSAQGAGLGRHLMDFAEQEAIRLQLPRLVLYANEVMVENLAIYAHMGYVEVERRTEDGYRRVFMEKLLVDHR